MSICLSVYLLVRLTAYLSIPLSSLYSLLSLSINLPNHISLHVTPSFRIGCVQYPCATLHGPGWAARSSGSTNSWGRRLRPTICAPPSRRASSCRTWAAATHLPGAASGTLAWSSSPRMAKVSTSPPFLYGKGDCSRVENKSSNKKARHCSPNKSQMNCNQKRSQYRVKRCLDSILFSEFKS